MYRLEPLELLQIFLPFHPAQFFRSRQKRQLCLPADFVPAGDFKETPSRGGANIQRQNLGRQGRELHRIGRGNVNTVRTQRNCRRSDRRSGGEQSAAVEA